jgi:hypothetical protein
MPAPWTRARLLALAGLAIFGHGLAACDGGSSPPDADPATIEPQICKDHCVVSEPPRTWMDCCDSTTCYVDHDTGKWVVVACDPPPPDPCLQCTADEICVQRFDGVCSGVAPLCLPRTVDCPGNVCSPDCEAAYCPSPYQCQSRVTCGGESPEAFTCYGP